MTARGSELKGNRGGSQSKPKPIQQVEFGAEFSRFINYKPSADEKEAFAVWASKANVWAILDELGTDGFKLTVAYDETSKAFNGMLMDRRSSSPVAGCILSVRGPEFSVALLRVLFVHSAVAGENWERLSVPVADDW